MLRCSTKLGPTKEAKDVGEGQKSTNIYTKLNISKTKGEHKKKCNGIYSSMNFCALLRESVWYHFFFLFLPQS